MNTSITSLVDGTLVLADWFLVTMVTLAVLGNVAVLLTKHVVESFFQEATRRLKIAGFAILAIRWWYLLITDQQLNIHVLAVMGLTLIATATTFSAFYALFGDEINAHNESKNLYGSQQHDS